MSSAQRARRSVGAMVIVAGMSLGLAAETAPGSAGSSQPLDVQRAEAIFRYIAVRNPDVPLARLRSYPAALLAAAQEHGIDHCFALAQAEVESQFTPDSVGRAGEIGLYQILPSTATFFGRQAQELFDPRINTRVALAYLRDILARRPSLRDALAEYNGGPRNRSPYYALTVLETYTQVLRHRDLGCSPHRNPVFAAPTHVVPAANVSRAAYHPSR